MGGGQRCGDEVPQCADAERNLDRDEVNDTEHTLLCVLRQRVAHTWREAGVCPQRHDSSEGCGGQDTVVELDEDGVLEHVAPPQIRLVGHVAVEGIEHLALGWEDVLAHPGEIVVDQAGVEAGNERAGHGRGEDQGGQGSGHDTEGTESR